MGKTFCKAGTVILPVLLLIVQGSGLAGQTRQQNVPPQKAAQKQEVLTNQSIIKLVKAGLPVDVINATINESEVNFDLSTDGLIALKEAKVPDEVLRAMKAKQSGSPVTTTPPNSDNTPPDAPQLGLPTEIGVYVKKKDQWVEVLPEVINWQTGGVIKSAVTFGIVKGDVNGRILNTHSPNSIAPPTEFLIVAQESIAITEYQFLKLREKKDVREFRTVTGGVFHQSGGAKRDLLPFPQWKKIGPRTYLVTFQTLNYGEYGFLPPGENTSSSASAQLGKMYTFRVVEER
ncbi:MAG: hypothetical protein ABIN58_01280 [candidate division WOR-3 bacterium]